jgi:bla regulator protein BlaR1
MISTSKCFVLALILNVAYSQVPPTAIHFEVASVRPHVWVYGKPQGGIEGGPGTSTPDRIDYGFVTLRNVFEKAYGPLGVRLRGPEWLKTEYYDIVATLHSGATSEELSLMLQELLSTRFHLKFHRESREMSVYSLIVAKTGAKVKPSQSHAERVLLAANKLQAYGATMGLVARALEGSSQFPQDFVVDKTGLDGIYDFAVNFAPNNIGATDDSGLPSLATALEQDLGLKLERSKQVVEIWVIDSADKIPTKN